MNGSPPSILILWEGLIYPNYGHGPGLTSIRSGLFGEGTHLGGFLTPVTNKVGTDGLQEM